MPDLDPLSPRARQILGLIARDWKNDQIARYLGVSTGAVSGAIRVLHARFGTRTRLALVLAAMAQGHLDTHVVLARHGASA